MFGVSVIAVHVSAEFMLVNTGTTRVNNGAVTGSINTAHANIHRLYVSTDAVLVNTDTTQVNADIAPVLHGSASVNTITNNAVSSPFGVTLTP